MEIPVRRARRLLFHPRTQMAVKAAVAATLAWLVAGALVSGTRLEGYRYYAPLGAVVTVYPTVAGSVRTSVQTVAAIATGGAVGLAVHALLEPGLAALALAVGGGVATAGLPFLGTAREYVPVVSLFVLVIGGTDPWGYALAYVALALLGAALAVLVGLAVPALRLTQSLDAVMAAQRVLADQLEDLADGLRQRLPPGADDWGRRQRDVTEAVHRMRAGVLEALDARRGNPRARFHSAEVERQRHVARALERVGLLVEDLVTTVSESHRAGAPTAIDHELALTVADAVERLAVLVRGYDTPMSRDDDRARAGEDAVRRLTAAFARRRDLDPRDLALLGSVVANLNRSLEAVLPADQRPAAARRSSTRSVRSQVNSGSSRPK
ncbi:MAG: hypothetical protein ACOYXW_07975 [Actinomycetota bacterium]